MKRLGNETPADQRHNWAIDLTTAQIDDLRRIILPTKAGASRGGLSLRTWRERRAASMGAVGKRRELTAGD